MLKCVGKEILHQIPVYHGDTSFDSSPKTLVSVYNNLMCGIAGFTGFENKKLLKEMSLCMQHRGPDGDGFFEAPDIGMLNRRLAIIDRKGGDQPIYNEDKTVSVVYNGEIYNYRELRAELEKVGHRFKTNADTEVIVHGYEEWGDTCFDRFNGMFGIALYDSKRKRMLLARDHFGIKPLYFATGVMPDSKKNSLVFGSEIKPILLSGIVEKKPNDKTLYRYLQYRIHDESRHTFFEGISRLLPGEYLVWENNTHTIKRFSHLADELQKIGKDAKEISEQDTSLFREKLIEAIRMRLVSEVPVGTCLSGGLDSSTVVAIANKLLHDNAKDTESLGRTQKAYSAVFPGSVNDEEKYIEALMKKTKNVDSIKIYPKPEEFFEEIEDFIKYQEEPTISTGPYAQYKVMERAHKDVTVLLDGQGADEMMAGYLPYYFVYLRQLKKQGKWGTLIQECLSSMDVLSKFGIMKLTQLLGFTKSLNPSSLLNNSFVENHRNEKFPVVSDNVKDRLIQDIFGNSLQSLLRYEDKNAMRFSIEGRVPFLDINLVRFLFSLSDEAIIKDGWNKAILRNAFRDVLPEIISERRNKIGFTTPEHEWFMRMKNRIYGIFLSESFANRPYVNQPAVIKAFEEFIQGKNDDTLLFWRLLNLEIWMRVYFDGDFNEGKKPVEEKRKGDFDANKDKKIEITVDGDVYSRFPIQTALFEKGDDYATKVAQVVQSFRKKLDEEKPVLSGKKWIAIISEKVVAISQGRSYFIWDIHPGFMAKTLAGFVKKTPYGIGLGSPWTMQLAINEVGLPRVLFAAVASVITKPFGVSGTFYHIVGRTVASIDGPTEYSLYPSNVSAKLGPKEPEKAAQQIAESIRATVTQKEQTHFMGAVIIDANDLGRDILGNASDLTDSQIAEIMRDNPMGQGSEQTPVVYCCW